MSDEFSIDSELTVPAAEHVRNIALMAAIIGSADSILTFTHDPNDLIDFAARIYNRTAARYFEDLLGEEVE